MAFTTENPDEAFALLCQSKPQLRTAMYQTIFNRTLPFFSRTLMNVERDWDKVSRYGKHLGLIDETFTTSACYSNAFLPDSPYSELKPIACCIE